MTRSRVDQSYYREIASELSLSVLDVQQMVQSFFSVILSDSRRLPFNTYRKIFSREVFLGLSSVRNMPGIGRIGPVYSRYLKWRGNEARERDSLSRSSCRKGRTRGEIEHIAETILSGGTPTIGPKRKTSELYDNVWMVGKQGKKLAKQVLKKDV